MCRWSYGNVFRAPHHNSCFEPLVLGLFSMCQMCKSRAKSPSSCSKQGKYLSSALQGNLLVTLSTSSKRKHGRNHEVIKNPNITFSAFPSRVLFKSKSQSFTPNTRVHDGAHKWEAAGALSSFPAARRVS